MVVAIMAIVASIAIPTVDLLQTRARTDATVEKMTTLKTALEEHFEKNLRFPSLVESLETLGYVASAFGAGDAFVDGWGNSYVYATAGDSATLTSLEADDVPSESDIELIVDGTRFLISRTRDDMATIHVALRNYEMARVSSLLPESSRGLVFRQSRGLRARNPHHARISPGEHALQERRLGHFVYVYGNSGRLRIEHLRRRSWWGDRPVVDQMARPTVASVLSR